MSAFLSMRGDKEESRFTFKRLSMSGVHESYALRYQVFCWETGIFSPQDYPDGSETDEYDNNSIHIGAFDDTGMMVGTVRLVRSSTLDLPMFKHCHRNDIRLPATEPMSVAEISRLAVIKNCHRHSDKDVDGLSDSGNGYAGGLTTGGKPDRRTRREIVLGLYRGVYHESKQSGVRHWLAAMEPSLGRLLKRSMGVGLEVAGKTFDYFGEVTPYVADVGALEQKAGSTNPYLYKEFTCGLPESLQPKVPLR